MSTLYPPIPGETPFYNVFVGKDFKIEQHLEFIQDMMYEAGVGEFTPESMETDGCADGVGDGFQVHCTIDRKLTEKDVRKLKKIAAKLCELYGKTVNLLMYEYCKTI